MITESDKQECELILDSQENQRTYQKNDIVFWHYSDIYLVALKGYSPYHCRSQIAVFDGEKFVDTFWYGNENFSFGPEKIGWDIVVEYVGNFADLEARNSTRLSYLRQYYDEKDIVNLNHPNNTSGNLYLRKGAKRSLEVMRESIRSKIREAETQIMYLGNSLAESRKNLEDLTEETIDSTYF